MNLITRKLLVRAAALAAIMAVSGCLSESSSDSDFSGDPPPPPSDNAPPTISGNPPGAVTIGDAYSFTPQASDPDGDVLTFSIENMPSWAEFDTNSGQLSGTPLLGDVGQYANIRISVSDNESSVALPSFTIEVTQVGTSSATLSWTAPTLNEDGTTLVDLAGYIIYYGTSSRNYTEEIRIDNPSITTYVVENLMPNTYYFAAKSFNADQVLSSQYSGEVVKNLE